MSSDMKAAHSVSMHRPSPAPVATTAYGQRNDFARRMTNNSIILAVAIAVLPIVAAQKSTALAARASWPDLSNPPAALALTMLLLCGPLYLGGLILLWRRRKVSFCLSTLISMHQVLTSLFVLSVISALSNCRSRFELSPRPRCHVRTTAAHIRSHRFGLP